MILSSQVVGVVVAVVADALAGCLAVVATPECSAETLERSQPQPPPLLKRPPSLLKSQMMLKISSFCFHLLFPDLYFQFLNTYSIFSTHIRVIPLKCD